MAIFKTYNANKGQVHNLPATGSVTWECPSNIALIKYWGKKGHQLPANPSLSMTLQNSVSHMGASWEKHDHKKGISFEFYFEGRKEIKFERKIASYLQSLVPEFPLLGEIHLILRSHNTFPHSSGIASSASSMGALALCLGSILFGGDESQEAMPVFFKRTSGLARLASGSASRSVYGGFSLWGETEEFPDSSDEYAIPYPGELHPDFMDMRDSILLVNPGEKAISSRAGHALMDNHPYAAIRYSQARENLKELMDAMAKGNFETFIRVVEAEALNLHALIMTSEPSNILLEPATLDLIRKTRDFRRSSGCRIAFTIDAGPNLHLLYPAVEENLVLDWLKRDMLPLCLDDKWISDRIGNGPHRIKNEMI